VSKADEIAQKWAKWPPPSPHREAIIDFVARGRASIVQSAPDQPPLLMFEDGGSMELSKVRCGEKEPFYHADRPEKRVRADYRATQYSDVCGTINELKRIIAEEPERTAQEPEYLQSLIDDARYMIGRMYLRQGEYNEFADRLAALRREMAEVPIQDRAPADSGPDEIERALRANPGCAATEKDRLDELAEQVRAVANGQEGRLREHKAVALDVYRAYLDIKGARDWSKEEAETEAEEDAR